jgi:hypothetical protein
MKIVKTCDEYDFKSLNVRLRIIATVVVDYDIIDLELQKREILSSTTPQIL